MKKSQPKRYVPDYQRALTTMKNIFDKDVYPQQNESIRKAVSDIKKIRLSAKSSEIVKVFYDKITRKVVGRKPPQDMKQKWEKTQTKKSLKGIEFPEQLEHLVNLLYILGLIVLLFISTFNGFIDRFSRQQSKKAGTYIALIIPLFMSVCHVIMNCIKQTFSNGKDLLYIKQITLNYVKQPRIVFDITGIVLTSIGLGLIEVKGIFIALFFILIFRTLFAFQDIIKLEMIYLKKPRHRLLWNLVKIIIFNILFAHFMATVLLGMSRYDPNDNWITKAGLDESTTGWFVVYVYAFYWASTIMMTVGFGDLLPNTWRQLLTTAFIEIFSCIVLAYNISEIGNIITQLRDSHDNIMRKMAIFERMKNRQKKTGNQIDPLLQKRIYNYIRQSETEDQNFHNLEQSQLLENLPDHLKTAYYKEANKSIFKGVLFFSYMKSETKQVMAVSLRNAYFYPGEYIRSSKGNQILILQGGTITLGYKRRGSTINGSSIDEINIKKNDSPALLRSTFLTLKKQSRYDLIAKTSSHIWKLSLDDFLTALDESDIDKQFYFSILHKDNYNIYVWDIIFCQKCVGSRHTSFECPKLHYKPLQSEIYMKNIYLSGQPQKRRQKGRDKRTKHLYGQSFGLKAKNQLIKFSEKYYKLQAGELDQYIDNAQYEYQQNRETKQKRGQKNSLALSKMDDQHFENIMFRAISQFVTNYRDEFWDIEADKAANFQFYFPNHSPNRLVLTTFADLKSKTYHLEVDNHDSVHMAEARRLNQSVN